ncbi:HAMP domain-containing protein [Peribacillus saganii]|uniref:histidine kinase n=1 Tax=Peribacillus saganii TaxID=2303992 RepID=A0A372LLM6_9BACI|nr:ATP-binding protein [Peribacillus saganii]RFU67803.1 HAMP domain-containing protein [Peribacillus saganii]
MMFWRSVVGKLWFTILLLVSFVLFILSVLLMEFFENFYQEEIENELTKTASRVVNIISEHEDTSTALTIASELLGDQTKIVLIEDERKLYSSELSIETGLSPSFFKEDPLLKQVFTKRKTVKAEMRLPIKNKDNQDISAIVVGLPLELDGKKDVIYFYQSLESREETIHSTTKFIFLAAGVAIILTTIFAFFLSTRITAPLRKMREAAFEVARGRFDTKVPILTHDEIGELATAFNQMGRQLKYNINALNQEKENLSSILSSMADGVITFNNDGTILVTNPPADRFLQNWYYEKGFIHEKQHSVPSVLMNLFNRSGEMQNEQVGEITLQGHDWVLIVSPLYNNESIRGAVAILRDMTEERKLDKLRKDFIANVSHELRTPISMLQGYSEAIIDDIAGSEEENKEMAKIIYDESLRMGRLVNDLLNLARMEAGHITLSYEKIDMDPYLNRITNKFHGLSKEKDITIKTRTEESELTWELDPDRIEQVLTNLIDNAIRHTPAGGEVEVIQWTDPVKGLVLSVRDSGSGIPEEDLAFVFERFYKADKARTRGSGTGLGLAIAKNIIMAHDGYISVNSMLEKGTTFTFNIPRKLQENE